MAKQKANLKVCNRFIPST